MDTSSVSALSSYTSMPERPTNTRPKTEADIITSSNDSHPRPSKFVEVLCDVRRVEERLSPFIERTHSILGVATSAHYNNNVR
ncbi:large proline-rich protein BAG6-like [Mastacembelus armatus]|uniref:large proline-rich protein BAG6-like n=1 Tax=Mastacembelus armatus TaxID=205130 RepID=UPI000E45BA72|nr:large proline-rich protein BAG6-like [Mastacembelus armatus]